MAGCGQDGVAGCEQDGVAGCGQDGVAGCEQDGGVWLWAGRCLTVGTTGCLAVGVEWWGTNQWRYPHYTTGLVN